MVCPVCVRRTPIGVIRCRSSLRSVRTVLAIVTAVLTTASTVVLTGVPYTSELLEAVIILGQRTDREKTGQGVLRHQVSVFKTCRAETSLVAVCAVHSLLV